MHRLQTENVNDKCHKTQSYIRNLVREETHLNENLSTVEDENKNIEKNLCELDTIIDINTCEISNKEKDCEECRYNIASKEL